MDSTTEPTSTKLLSLNNLRPRVLLDQIADAANQVSIITLYSILVLSTSIFIYITIYSTYVPIVQHTRPVHLQFDTTCSQGINCSNPYAFVNFNDNTQRAPFYLSRGQSYKFILALEMPESDVNWKQGMFMIRLRLIESQGQILFDISRPAILKYKTLLTRIIYAIIYWPLLVTSYRNEMQTLHVALIDNYIEGAKMDRAMVEIIARDIQIYSAQIYIQANLSGLSYYMQTWPITTALVGISTLALFMAMLTIYKGHSKD